jgi:hypothetical protein
MDAILAEIAARGVCFPFGGGGPGGTFSPAPGLPQAMYMPPLTCSVSPVT